MFQPELLYQARRFRVLRATQQMPDGSRHQREIIAHPGAVAILPLDDQGRVCLIENYRVTAGRFLYELPAGTLEPGEPPELAARRELTEETGYRAEQLQLLTQFFTSPGILATSGMYLYLATGLKQGPPAREAGEEIHNRLVPWAEAFDMVRQGRIEDAKTLVGLLYYATFRAPGLVLPEAGRGG